MTEAFQLFIILIPASLVLFGMYVSVHSLLQKQAEIKSIEVKADSRKTTLPLQLQAYERIILLLERISPANLLMRLNAGGFNVADFQQIIIREIREEFSHNLSQQIYMTNNAWGNVKSAVESTIGFVNEAASDLDKQAPGIELSKKILKNVLGQTSNQIENSIESLKAEIRENLL